MKYPVAIYTCPKCGAPLGCVPEIRAEISSSPAVPAPADGLREAVESMIQDYESQDVVNFPSAMSLVHYPALQAALASEPTDHIAEASKMVPAEPPCKECRYDGEFRCDDCSHNNYEGFNVKDYPPSFRPTPPAPAEKSDGIILRAEIAEDRMKLLGPDTPAEKEDGE